MANKLSRIQNIHLDERTKPRSSQRSRIVVVLLLFVLVLILSGCDNTFSVFKAISEEKKQTGADLFLNTEVRGMAYDSSNYYALLARVHYRPIAGSGTAWTLLSVDGSTDYFAAGLASSGGTLYVAKADRNNILDDIYETSDSGATWKPMNARAAIETALGSAPSIDWIKCINGTLFVAAHDTSLNYSMFYYDGAAFVSTGIARITDAPKDIVFDGTTYWLISISKVYAGALGSMTEDSTSGNPYLSSALLTGVATDGTGRVLVARNDGKAFSHTAGTWTSFVIKASTKLGPVFLLSQGGARILVGKSATYGYMEYDESASSIYDNGSKYLTASSSIYYSAMVSKTLIGFWQPDTNKNVLFALLAAGGSGSYALYRNEFDGTDWSGWTAE